MEQKRKKSGIELLPTLHKRLKQIALDRGVPLWSLTQEAIEQWLLREVPGKDERGVTTSTNSSKDVNEIGTFNQADTPIDRKIERKSTGQGTGPGGQETDQLTEIKSGERFGTSVPPGQTDSARVATAFEEVNRALADVRALMGRVAESLARSEKTTKPANRAKRMVPPRKRKHPPRFESGA